MKLNELFKDQLMNRDVIDVAKSFAQKKDTEQDVNRFDDLLRDMEAKGWQYVDSGYYSHVFTNPAEKYVIKINKRKDDGFGLYAYLTTKIKNKHFLKVSSARVLTVGNEKVYMYAVEKLKPIPQWFAASMSEMCNAAATRFTDKKSMAKLSSKFSFGSELYNSQKESLIKACMILGENSGDNLIDINHTNIMQREDGTLVIIDPFSRE